LIGAASVLSVHIGSEYRYAGKHRQQGPWEDPNVYGLLMSTGIVLAIGELFQQWRIEKCGVNGYRRLEQVVRYCSIGFLSTVCYEMLVGLLNSYSRGSWLAGSIGVLYITIWFGRHATRLSGRRARNAFKIALIILTVLSVACWRCRDVWPALIKRTTSLTNQNDLSWRNRVAAWEGALQLMAEHPLAGTGWERLRLLYDNYYRPIKLTEGAAVETNDLLVVGATLGIPALFCVALYLWLLLRVGNEHVVLGASDATHYRLAAEPAPLAMLKASCRAATVVLLVGFWFDGGLLKMPTATTFWILLELGRP
jgi:O-antigen ligase